MQHDDQNQRHLPKYDDLYSNMPNVKIVCCKILTKTVGVFYKCTGEARVVEPDPLSKGFRRYSECGMEHFVFEFLLNYVRKIKSDKEWRKLLKMNPTKPFLLFVTPSDILTFCF